MRDAAQRLGLAGQRLLVAVSGGLDSSVLLYALARVAGGLDLRLVVGHVDHGLRGAASRADRKAVEAQAVALGLACRALRIDVEAARVGHPSRSRPTLQEAARALRYEALGTMAREVGASRIATAHHLDDQAETVLLRVMRGTSVDGIGGIPELSRSGFVVRPLLAVRRHELLRYAQARRLRWREDASNENDAYARNRLRRQFLPALEEAFNPGLVCAVGRLAESQRRDAEWISGLVDAAFEERFTRTEENRLESVETGWKELPEALARRLVARAIETLGGGRDLDRRHLERALAFLREGPGAPGGREIELPGGLRLRRQGGCLILHRKRPESG
ncbi:MAG: tRNA lysidine(34) synthetase TilS [bacterium]|nr:tRNA lysidine(34) synthetase TilS [bacterium]